MKVQHEQLGEILLPDFLIVGAAKSATSSLHWYCNNHPQISMPSVKETWFFSFMNNRPNYNSPGILNDLVSNLEDYVALFKDADPSQTLGDASPSYLYTYADTIRNIKAVYPPESLKDLRIIISLREPASRAFSQYMTFKRVDDDPLTFEQAIDSSVISQRLSENWNIFYDYLGFGNYHEQVKAFIEAFGAERVKVVLYDDIQQSAVGTCQSIFEFVGVDPTFAPDTSRRSNAISGVQKVKWPLRILRSRNPLKRALAACIPKSVRELILVAIARMTLRKATLDDATRTKLVRIYAEEVVKLEALIGRDLSHWRVGAEDS